MATALKVVSTMTSAARLSDLNQKYIATAKAICDSISTTRYQSAKPFESRVARIFERGIETAINSRRQAMPPLFGAGNCKKNRTARTKNTSITATCQ
ncbi:hypothetical protein D9M71_836610 [compost metagenome]